MGRVPGSSGRPDRAAVQAVRAALCLIACVQVGQAGADTVYVTLEKESVVATFDGETGMTGERLLAGGRPRGILAGSEARTLFIAASDDDSIGMIEPSGLRVIKRLPTDRDPKTFALSPDKSRLYVSSDRDNQLTVIDVSTSKVIKRIPVGREPEGVSVSPDGRWVVSTSEADNLAVWIDSASLEVAARTQVAKRPRYSRFSDDGARLWVTSQDGACVTVIDAGTRQVLKVIGFEPPGVPRTSLGPVGIRIDKLGHYAYVALGRADHVAVVDAQKLETVRYIAVGRRVWNLEFSPDQSRLYAANGLSGDVSVIALPDWRVVRTVHLGDGPWGIAVLP